MIFTLAELAEEAEREVKERARLYPGKVATGRLNAGLAERRLAKMTEIARKLREMEQAEMLV